MGINNFGKRAHFAETVVNGNVGHGGTEIDKYRAGHGEGNPGGCDGDPDDGRGGADRG